MSDLNNSKEEEKEYVRFHEFHESTLNDIKYNGAPLDNGMLEMAIAEREFNECDINPKYRSISAVSSAQVHGFNVGTNAEKLTSLEQVTTLRSDRNTTKQGLAASQPVEVASSSSQHEGTGKSSKLVTVPNEPIFVSPSTHFETTLPVDDVTARVEMGLNSELGVSYEFFPSRCRWECVYLVGSSRCKFEVNVYKKPDNASLIVEGNRLSGDSYAFVTMYQSIRNEFDASSMKSLAPMLPIPGDIRELDKEEIEKSVDSVLAMAQSDVGEAQVGASQIFCDMFKRSDMLQVLSKYSECITALVRLMNVEFECCNQHAACALADLSSQHNCQKELMKNISFWKNLLPLCTDCPFSSIEMHRECARLLANVSSSSENSAKEIVSCVGLENVQDWLHAVDSMKDERLRLHAYRAKESLSRCIAGC